MLIKFSTFSTTVVCLLCNKTINSKNKKRRCNKPRFLKNTLKKTPSSGKSLNGTYSMFGGCEGKGDGVGWALIRGRALIQINKVTSRG